MLNKTTSSCKRCMHLIRLIVLKGLEYNFRVYAVHVKTSDNYLADSLSRLQFKHFWKLAGKNMQQEPEELPKSIWPVSLIWDGFKF